MQMKKLFVEVEMSYDLRFAFSVSFNFQSMAFPKNWMILEKSTRPAAAWVEWIDVNNKESLGIVWSTHMNAFVGIIATGWHFCESIDVTLYGHHDPNPVAASLPLASSKFQCSSLDLPFWQKL